MKFWKWLFGGEETPNVNVTGDTNMNSMFPDHKEKITNYSGKYSSHNEAVVISCFFNPQNSVYRLKAFNTFYETIKHLNHRIIECVIGDSQPQLPTDNPNITRVYTQNLLWHKESLLNKIVSELPPNFKYVFWVDADVLFTNKDWLVDGVKEMKEYANVIQPFDYCVHLEKGEIEPSFDVEEHKNHIFSEKYTNRRVWKSFCSTWFTSTAEAMGKKLSETYDLHGHVGFAWGARREILEKVPLYDKALVGGADHIIAHAAVGEIPHLCITKSFTDNIDEINEWSEQFYEVVQGKIGWVSGDLYHIWHGDINQRQYLKRIQEFTPQTKNIKHKDKNGLYVTDDDQYVRSYFKKREVGISDDGFLTSMMVGYVTDNVGLGFISGGNLMGAIIGEELRDISQPDVQFGDGQFGGGGAGGEWGNEPVQNSEPVQESTVQSDSYPVVPNSEVSSDNFS